MEARVYERTRLRSCYLEISIVVNDSVKYSHIIVLDRNNLLQTVIDHIMTWLQSSSMTIDISVESDAAIEIRRSNDNTKGFVA